MSEHGEGPPEWDDPAAGQTQPLDVEPQPGSPFARPPGYQGNIGYGPPPAPEPAAPPEPRFAGPYAAQYAEPVPPWQPPAQSFPAATYPATDPWGMLPPQSGEPQGPRSRKPWILVTVLVLALIVGGGTTIGLLGSRSKSGSPPAADPNLPSPLSPATPAPSTTPDPNATPSPNATPDPANPLPNLGIETPPALLAIGYHAYSSRLREPDEVAIDSAEVTQFKRYGLDQIVGLNALTLGAAGVVTDDYDADISILRFKDAVSAKAELDYSNMRNKKDADATLISLPGLPDVTAFLNSDASTGYSIGAFASVGRYQVVLILGGLTPNVPKNSKVLAAEAARVMKALLPAAAGIEPQDPSGGSSSPTNPSTPSQSPSGVPVPSATPSGIHA